MKVVIGLGNPGAKYEGTRHNVGFMTLDKAATMLQTSFTQTKFKAHYTQTHYNNEKVLLLKPLTYMNLSGQCIGQLIEFYDCSINDLLIVHDDLDLPFGQLKLRMKGGAGGHNGLKSVIQHLGTTEFKRIRMGIGRPEHGHVVDYVLQSFSKQEFGLLEPLLKTAAEACLDFIDHDFPNVMNKYNQLAKRLDEQEHNIE